MIRILSHRQAAKVVSSDDYVLLLNSPHSVTEAVKKIRETAKDCLYLEFHDVPIKRPSLVEPKSEDVAAALEWIKDKDHSKVICSCEAGISRSSAMAYVISCQSQPPEEAIKALDVNVHIPNTLIVSLGADLLGKFKPAWGEDTERKPRSSHNRGLNEYEFSRYYSVAKEVMCEFRDFMARQDQVYHDMVPLEISDEEGA
jgi:predicted protein tyrosine phosphatase